MNKKCPACKNLYDVDALCFEDDPEHILCNGCWEVGKGKCECQSEDNIITWDWNKGTITESKPKEKDVCSWEIEFDERKYNWRQDFDFWEKDIKSFIKQNFIEKKSLREELESKQFFDLCKCEEPNDDEEMNRCINCKKIIIDKRKINDVIDDIIEKYK
jgi:hypothetical protein